MTATLATKLGLKENTRAFLLRAPPDVTSEIRSGSVKIARSLSGSFTFIHAFFVTAAKLDAKLPSLKKHLADGGALWISWPKAKKLETDLSLTKIIAIGYRHGLVESKTIGVDSTWSAIKFTWPKKGKAYRNSYGKLKKHA